MLIVKRPPFDHFTMNLFCKLLTQVPYPVDSLYVWSPVIDPAYKGFSVLITRDLIEWHPDTETEYRSVMFNYIKRDTVIIGVKDHLTSYNYNPWTESTPQIVAYLKDFLDFYKDKKVILFTSVENLEYYIPNANIICWGGDLTNQVREYPKLDPILNKNLNSDKIFISLNRNPRWHRAMLVSLLFGLGIEDNGIISCMFKDNVKNPIKESGWKFTNKQKHIKSLISTGFKKLVKSFNGIDDDYEIYHLFQQNDNVSNFKYNLSSYYTEIFVEIVTETSYTEKSYLLTEKTLNSFYACNFPIILTSPGAVALLREIGFDMFDDIIDHSYDTIENPIDRLYSAISSNIRLLTDKDYVKEQWLLCQDRFINNVSIAKEGMYKYYRRRATQRFLELIES